MLRSIDSFEDQRVEKIVVRRIWSGFIQKYGCLRIIIIIIIIIREKAFREMKKDVGMTTAQRRMEMGSIFVLYIKPTIPTYTSGSFRL